MLAKRKTFVKEIMLNNLVNKSTRSFPVLDIETAIEYALCQQSGQISRAPAIRRRPDIQSRSGTDGQQA